MKIDITLVKRVLVIAIGAALALLLLPLPVFAQKIPPMPSMLARSNGHLSVLQPGVVSNIDYIKVGAK